MKAARAVAMASLALAVSGAASAANHLVVIEAMQYSPKELVVRKGDTIEWVNKDPFPHDVTEAARRRGVASGSIAPEGRWKLKVTREDGFAYRCSLHPMMQGRVVVR